MSQKKLIVTGASGFVGSRLCAIATKNGLEVTPALRNPSIGEGVVVGDVNSSTDWSAALADKDAAVHLAARVHLTHDTATDAWQPFAK